MITFERRTSCDTLQPGVASEFRGSALRKGACVTFLPPFDDILVLRKHQSLGLGGVIHHGMATFCDQNVANLLYLSPACAFNTGAAASRIAPFVLKTQLHSNTFFNREWHRSWQGTTESSINRK
jgi:hypothetical protein